MGLFNKKKKKKSDDEEVEEEEKDSSKDDSKEKDETPEDKAGDEDGEGEDGEEGDGKKSKKKLVIIIAIVVLILAGAGAGLHFSGMLGGGEDTKSKEEQALLAPHIEYYTLDEFLVNLNNPGKQVSFLKMKVTLELPNLATRGTVESKMPHIRDTFQVYLRELRNSDLQGSAALTRLREELLMRVNKVIEPEKVTDILFVEIIVQ